ncbi:MAG: iron-sulfur cluster assembly protein, partial [Roseimicrobium sp.]
MLTEDHIRTALAQVKYPGFTRDIVSFGLIKAVRLEGPNVQVDITLATQDANIPRQIHEEATRALQEVPGVAQVKLNFDIKNPPNAQQQPASAQSSIPGVRHVIAIASGKGGVGKSTVAANLAIALRKTG